MPPHRDICIMLLYRVSNKTRDYQWNNHILTYQCCIIYVYSMNQLVDIS